MNVNYPKNTNKPMFSDYIGNQIQLPQIEVPQTQDFSKFPNTYITNNSVSPGTAYIFFMAVQKYKNYVLMYHGNDSYEKTTELVSFILTQETNIFVRHDRWIYFYNGKIYEQCPQRNIAIIKIRELCENAKLIWYNFNCNINTPEIILRNIEQTAPELDYPYDISNYIVMNNGVLNLNTNMLEPFMPGRFITNMVVVDWNPEAVSCPIFDNIINTYTQGDNVLAERIFEALGVCLTNDTVKKYICFLGITNSGKSFLLSLLLSLLNNQSFVVMQPNDFDQRFAASMIYGKSVCACMDMDAAPLNTKATAFLKSASGFDFINAEFKHENGYVIFRSRVHIILCSNFDIVPEVPDSALENRKLVIPFQYRLTDDIVPFEVLMESLQTEKPAIVNKLIKAFLRLRANNYEFSGTDSWYNSYVPPMPVSLNAVDSLDKFIKDKYYVTTDANYYEFTDDMFERYKEYSAENEGMYRFSGLDAFSKALKSISYLNHQRMRKTSCSNPQSCYSGIVYMQPSPLLDTL